MPNSLIRDPGDTDIRPQHAKRSSFAFWKRADVDKDLEVVSAVPSPSWQSFVANSTFSSPPAAATEEVGRNPTGPQHPIGTTPHFKQGYSLFPEPEPNPDTYKQKSIPAPVPRYDVDTISLRERRFLGLPYGGTVVVHYLKRNEWFMETALALLGRQRMWDTGLDAPAHPPYIPSQPGKNAAPPQQHLPDSGKDVIVSPVPTWSGKGEVELASPQWGSARMYGSPLIRENGFVSLGRTVPWDALQKSEDAKYGKLKGTPRQRYADLPDGNDPISSSSNSDHDVAASASSSRTESSQHHTSPTPLSSLHPHSSSSEDATPPQKDSSASSAEQRQQLSHPDTSLHFQKFGAPPHLQN